MAAKQDKRIASATFFTTLLDFTEPGELGVFIDEEQFAALEQQMNKKGYLEGSQMANTFNMLRANDLIWSFVVNNYLLGKEPFPFDLLYWNSDSTRMPAAMHSFYLRNMYQENRLSQARRHHAGGRADRSAKIDLPTYFLSTARTISRPGSRPTRHQLVSGPMRFVLGGSGHIAGVVNPPAANKYYYWTNAELARPPTSGWQLRRDGGSWWSDWAQWIAHRAGKSIPARQPGSSRLPLIEDAPGAYVETRVD